MIEAPPRSVIDRAIALGRGPLWCSATVAVEPWPAIVWDTNGYYRELGVHHRATRRELREAYQRLGGQHSRRLTYIMDQLLDPEVRRAYDSTPFGSLFLDDYVAEEVRRLSAQQTAQRLRAALQRGDRTILEEPSEMVDWEDVIGETPDSPPEQRITDGEVVSRATPWGYSFLVVDLDDRVVLDDLARRWQQVLVGAFGSRPELGATDLVVGITAVGGVTPACHAVHAEEGRLVIAFLRCDVDDENHMVTLAERVVAQSTGR